MRTTLLLAVVAFFSLPILAQQSLAEAAAQARTTNPALPPDAATPEQIMTLLDLMQVRQNMVAAMGNMRQIMKQSMTETLRKKLPNPTPKQIEALQGIFDDIDVPVDEMIKAIIPIYQRHFTTKDVEDLIRFYSSPIGQKLLHEQPQLVQESMQVGADIQRKRMDEIMAKMDARIQRLTEAGAENGNPPKN